MCFKPWYKKDFGKYNAIPCGKCPKCVARKISGWSFRMMQEERVADSAYFITLTYNDDNVPITKNGNLTLRKRDCQLFLKRLRRSHDRMGFTAAAGYKPLKYYLAGEYGSKTYRPHYHLILFNAQLDVIIGRPLAIAVRRGIVALDGVGSFECKVWDNGHINVGQVSEASVGYTMKYMSKPAKAGRYRCDDRQKEFALMSKGIGKAYVTFLSKQWHKHDLKNRMYVPLSDGKIAAMPRYLKEKIYTSKQRDVVANHQQKVLHEKFVKQQTFVMVSTKRRDRILNKLKQQQAAAYNRMLLETIDNEKI